MPARIPPPTVHTGTATITYRREGTGPTVVLLHALASSSATWSTLTRDLVTSGREVIAPDLRGHGDSSWTSDYLLDSMEQDITGALDTLGAKSFDLVGHSLGAHLAALLAGRHPARVRKLVLEDPPVPPRTAPPRRPRRGVALYLTAHGLVSRRFDRRLVAPVLTQLRAPDPAWWDAVSAIEAPTLVVGGGPRSSVPGERLTELAATIPNADLVTIDAGHHVHGTRPEEFRDAVLRFLG
ncbi:alpha/beta fold hydrolase [Lentzea sp. CA-135723]|uniref:alpha/beta fold hydrolase n=1 Tax=Lentzea sp. CA-135723 TaxID=3239950 RepID=UPI003D8A9482